MNTRYNKITSSDFFSERRLLFNEKKASFECPQITKFELMGGTLYFTFLDAMSSDFREKLSEVFGNMVKCKGGTSMNINFGITKRIEHATYLRRNRIEIIVEFVNGDGGSYAFKGEDKK